MLKDTGFEIKTLPEIIEELATAQQAIFAGLNLDPSTPDGQLNGIVAEMIYSTYELALDVYNGLDPRVAGGIMLDRVCAITGIVRLQESATIVDVTFTGTALTLIPKDTVVSASTIDGVTFPTVADVTILAGQTTAAIEVKANAAGAVIVSASAIDTIDTPLAGISSVTNDDDGITGRLEETDQQLRIRRERSVAILSNSLIDSLYARIANVEGVTGVVVYENKTSAVDSKGIDPHSVWCIMHGGLDNDIATAIMETVSLGCGFKGAEVVPWVDSSGFSHDVKFDRASDVDIFVSVDIISPNYNPAFGDEIKQKIVDYVADVRAGKADCISGSFGIAEVVYASTLYAAIIGSGDYTVTEILIGLSSPGALQTISIDYDELAAFEVGNITVTVAP